MHHAGFNRPAVLALPRGGVPVAYHIARALAAPLDVLLVRKLGAPGQPELALGAVCENGVRVLNAQLAIDLNVSHDVLAHIEQRERERMRAQAAAYRSRQPIDPRGRNVVLVDDGVATGATMIAAIQAVRAKHAESITVAVPVGTLQSLEDIQRHADAVYALAAPERLCSVGSWYADFSQVSDEDVRKMLA